MEFRKLNYCRQSLDKLKAEHDVKCGKRGHSAYSRGVLEYAEELLDSLFECAEYDGEEPCNEKLLRRGYRGTALHAVAVKENAECGMEIKIRSGMVRFSSSGISSGIHHCTPGIQRRTQGGKRGGRG